jgi:hypothetical protein
MTTWKRLYAENPRLLPAAALAGAVLGLDLWGAFGNAVGVLYVAPLLLVGLGSARQKPRIVAIAGIGSALTVVGFALSSGAAVSGVAVVNRVLTLLAIWLAASLCLICLRVEEDDVVTAREFLPICASCKKIRDDEGQWNHVESYISRQWAITFTHGICPDCVRQLYPQVVKKHLRYSDLVSRPASPKPAPGSLAG